MASEIDDNDRYYCQKVMTAEELRSSGLLSEINRRLLHPVGLALGLDDEGIACILGTDDPAGFIFDESDLKFEAAEEYDRRFYSTWPHRLREYGYSIQPITEDMNEKDKRSETT